MKSAVQNIERALVGVLLDNFKRLNRAFRLYSAESVQPVLAARRNADPAHPTLYLSGR